MFVRQQTDCLVVDSVRLPDIEATRKTLSNYYSLMIIVLSYFS